MEEDRLTLGSKLNSAPWGQRRQGIASWIDFGQCKTRLQEADGDACVVLDCCSAAAAALDPNQTSTGNAFEILAACAWRGKTPQREYQRPSFTMRLIDILSEDAGLPKTLNDLNVRLMTGALGSGLKAMPWHGAFGGSKQPITLQRLPTTGDRAAQRTAGAHGTAAQQAPLEDRSTQGQAG